LPTQDEVTLAAQLVHHEIVDQREMMACLALHEKAERDGEPIDLGEVLLDRGLVSRAELDSMRGVSLVETQPLDDYRFERLIAEGGMARVYLAKYKPLKEKVALKIMKPELARQEDFRLRFLREAKLLMKLGHPNIVKGYEIRRAEGYVFCAMEHVDGATVEDRIEKDGPFDERLALYVTREVAEALIYLNSRGVVHRDLKPGNFLITESGQVKIIDLGLAKLRRGMTRDSEEGKTVGTVEYLSPEQARGQSDVDIRSDIYSLGVSLFHMVVGEVPFKGENNMEVIAKQVLQALQSPALKSRKVSAYTHYFIQKMMAKDRTTRFQTPEDLIAEIASTAGDVSDSVRPSGSLPVVRPVVERERRSSRDRRSAADRRRKGKRPPRRGPGRGRRRR
jgi:serine/threonine-protein kinase